MISCADLRAHFSRSEVIEESFKFLKGRWIAATLQLDDEVVFRRYIDGAPMRAETEKQLADLLENLRCVRTLYGSIEIYKVVRRREDLFDPENIISCMPVWDIDSSIEYWEVTKEAARLILKKLDEFGVKNSKFVLWSGNGAHVHLNHRSISDRVLEKHSPLDTAWSIVELIRIKAQKDLRELISEHRSKKLDICNEIMPRRVFTAPLSIHRKLEVVTVPLSPEDLEEFSIEWTDPGSFKYSKDWNNFFEGEADDLALEALRRVGGYPAPSRKRVRMTRPLEDMIRRALRNTT